MRSATLLILILGPRLMAVPSVTHGTGSEVERAVIGSDFDAFFTIGNPEGTDLAAVANGIVGGQVIQGGPPWTAALNQAAFAVDTTGTPGQIRTVGLDLFDGPSLVAGDSWQMQLLENRTLSASIGGGNSIDLGRHLLGERFLVTLDGGSQTHATAADGIWSGSLFKGGYNNELGELNLRNNHGSPTSLWVDSYYEPMGNFDSPNQSYNMTVEARRAGSFDYQINMASELVHGFRPETLISGNAMPGVGMISDGGLLNIAGTGLENRRLELLDQAGVAAVRDGGLIPHYVGFENQDSLDETLRLSQFGILDFDRGDAGALWLADLDAGSVGQQYRVMRNASGTMAGETRNLTLNTFKEDNRATRVYFDGIGTVSENGINVETGTGSTLFNGGSVTRDLTVNTAGVAYGAGATIDTSSTGFHFATLDLNGHQREGEDPGVGQSLGNLSVGVGVQVVDNRPVSLPNSGDYRPIVTALNGHDVQQLTVRASGEIGSFTNPTITSHEGVSLVLSNITPDFDDQFNVNLGTTNEGNGSRTLAVTPEGLSGEAAAYDIDYDWSVSRINAAEGELTVDIGPGPTAPQGFDFVGFGSIEWEQTNVGPGVAESMVGILLSGDAWHAWDFSIVESNDTYQLSSVLTATQPGRYIGRATAIAQHSDQTILGTSLGDLGSLSGYMEHYIAPAPGQHLKSDGFLLSSIAGFGTSLASIGSGEHTFEILNVFYADPEDGIVNLRISSDSGGTVQLPNGDTAGFAEGELVGLDGIMFVMQGGYDENELIAKFGTEEVAMLLWENESGVFVNSVLGNSDGQVGDQFLDTSYAEYLTIVGGEQNVILGDFGFDLDGDVAWAVLDHNSTFGTSGAFSTIPEPSTLLTLTMGSLILSLRRRRDPK